MTAEPHFDTMTITSPKRVRTHSNGWDAHFPYYAGYPATFAFHLIKSAQLGEGARVYDPWNGSGTTTSTANALGYHGIGVDLNPAMVIIAKARALQPTEADSLLPLANELLNKSKSICGQSPNDPLLYWFTAEAAAAVRSIETSIRKVLIGDPTHLEPANTVDRMSSIASIFYVALFAVCRSITSVFKTSNPTWLRYARSDDELLSLEEGELPSRFLYQVQAMAQSLTMSGPQPSHCHPTLLLGNSVEDNVEPNSIDFVLTSPPYCTRLDYTSATRVELAIAQPLFNADVTEISRQMVGSTRAPVVELEPQPHWGKTCLDFIAAVSSHRSKASSGYYRRNHIDYFDKLDRSLGALGRSLKCNGAAVIVVQDSYYKDVHNDLPRIVTELCESHSLHLKRREDFRAKVTLAASHPHFSKYLKPKGATEAVLCFSKT